MMSKRQRYQPDRSHHLAFMVTSATIDHMEETFTLVQTAGLYIHHLTDPVAFWIFCLCITALLVWGRRFRESLIFAISLLLTAASVSILKVVFALERPQEALVVVDSYAFPSGHAASSTALALLLIWILYNGKGSPTMKFTSAVCIALLAGAISYSRIAIGVHTTTDVVAGIALGCIIVFTTIAGARYAQGRTL